MGSCRTAIGEINVLIERISFDEDLIATLYISVGSFQIKDEVGCGICARGEHGIVQSSFGVDSRAGEIQFDIFGKSSATSDVWSGPGEVESRSAFIVWVNASF